MKRIVVGDKAPDFSLPDQHGEQICLVDFRGEKSVVVFFYPADESPICTREACAFRDAYQDFSDAGAVVIGISADKMEKHQSFATNHRLPFHLLSDSEGGLRKAFGVPRSLGLLPGRVTYVIDPHGFVRHFFNAQFTAERHVQEALKMVREIGREEGQ
jgi:peroxiredoxin Q/BCP